MIEIKAKVHYGPADNPKPPFLNDTVMVPASPAIIDMRDVDSTTMVNGGILFWTEDIAKFTIQQFDPSKVVNITLDGGTF